MVLMLNFLLFALLSLIALVSYWNRKKGWKAAAAGMASALFVTILYANIQPSYLPKGKVPAMKRVPYEKPSEAKIEDRLLKPMSEEDRQKRVDEIITVRSEVLEVIGKQ